MERIRVLTNDEIEDMLEYDFEDETEHHIASDIEDISNHDSESEQSIPDEDELEADRGFDDNEIMCSDSAISKTSQHNIIRFIAGPTLALNDCQSVVQVFRAFFTNQMIDLIVTHTNQEIFRVTQKY